jgi:hypothetical protein
MPYLALSRTGNHADYFLMISYPTRWPPQGVLLFYFEGRFTPSFMHPLTVQHFC